MRASLRSGHCSPGKPASDRSAARLGEPASDRGTARLGASLRWGIAHPGEQPQIGALPVWGSQPQMGALPVLGSQPQVGALPIWGSQPQIRALPVWGEPALDPGTACGRVLLPCCRPVSLPSSIYPLPAVPASLPPALFSFTSLLPGRFQRGSCGQPVSCVPWAPGFTSLSLSVPILKVFLCPSQLWVLSLTSIDIEHCLGNKVRFPQRHLVWDAVFRLCQPG